MTVRKPQTLIKRLKGLILFSFAFCLLLPPTNTYSQSHDQTPQEYGLKAIYLYNFLQFVYWPEGKCLLNGQPVREIAVIGRSPIETSLQALKAELKKNQDTEISVRFLGSYVEGMDLSGCRLLFITQDEMKHMDKILNAIGNEPVLTVADSEDCLEKGCMIALLSRMNKIRWAVNRQTIEQAGLRLNSRMLTMAVKVIH